MSSLDTIAIPTSFAGDFNRSGYKASNIGSDIYHDISSNIVHPITGDALLLSDLDAIKSSIVNIILTPIGTRPFYPNFGSRITALLFEPADPVIEVSIRDEMIRAIRQHESRVSSLQVSTNFKPDRNAYEVTLNFEAQWIGLATIEFLLNRIR